MTAQVERVQAQVERVQAQVERVQAQVERAQQTKLLRVWARYGQARGNVLAGGIAYFAFFSLFPALAVGFTVLGLVAGDRPGLQARIVEYVNATFGGAKIIGTAPGDGLVQMGTLVSGNVLTLVGIGGLVLLLFTGLGWIGALRDGLGAVFGAVRGPNPFLAKVADLAALISFGAAALASMTASVLVTTTAGTVLGWIGLAGGAATTALVTVVTSLVVLAIDTGLFLLLFRLLSGTHLPAGDVFSGALGGAVALGLLKLLGGVVVQVSSGNRFFAAFVIVAGLLVWMNLAARATLLAGSWAAVTATDRGHLPGGSVPVPPSRDEVPAGPLAPRPGSRVLVVGVHGTPTYSERAADRTALLAGAVLGITAAVAVRTIARAGTSLRHLGRDHATP